MKQKNNKRQTMSWLWTISGRLKWSVALQTFVQITVSICSVGYALLLREIINAAVAGERELFSRAVIIFAGLVCIQLALRVVTRFLLEYTSSGLENCFKERLFRALLDHDYASVTAVHSGEWMNRLTNDASVAAKEMSEILPGFAGMVVKLVSALAMLVVLEPRFLWLIILGGILLICFSTAFRRVLKCLHKHIQEADGKLRVFLQETLGSLLVVRSYAVEEDTISTSRKRMEEHRRARMKRNHFSNFCNVGFGIIMNGAYVLGAFFCGYGILTGTMEYGTFTAVLQLVGQIQSPFVNISGFMPRFYAMLASAERLMEIEVVTAADTIKVRPLEEALNCYTNGLESFGFCNAVFAYPARTTSLKAVNKSTLNAIPNKFNLEIQKYEFVAFVGPSGCGKSTVLKLLMCTYSLDNGERYMILHGERIVLDRSWQKLFAYVPQGNHLLSGTIREIVSFANRKAANDEHRLKNALTVACAEFVYDLEDGIDTVLGERGTGLSEGQMQRLAIARAIFSEHPILMLDECTSALDDSTERQLLQNIRSMTDKTVLIITHRQAALEICDRIIELDTLGCTEPQCNN